jgi:hypothetical protein
VDNVQDIVIDTTRWVGDAFIPDLPDELQRVPGFRLKPGIEQIPTGWKPTPGEPNPFEDQTWRSDYFDWRQQLVEYRNWMWQRCETNEAEREAQKLLCFGDPAKGRKGCPKYFGAMYGWIQEPRQAGLRGSTWSPFVPYHYQLHQTDLFTSVIGLPFEEEIDIWEPKSRGLGVSWNRSKDDLWAWMSIPEARILLMSRNQSFVDSEGNVDALFEKILTMIRRMPEWMRPEGFHEKMPWRKTNYLHNEVNGAEIIGAPNTPDAGRAGRYLYGFVDEAAKIRNLAQLLGSLRGSMKKVFYTSTEDREVTSGKEWLEEWQATKRVFPAAVIEWNWHQNPTMDTAWERTVLQRAGSNQNGVKLEYFRDVFAGSGSYIYPLAKDIKEANHPYDSHKKVAIVIDPGQYDATAFTVSQPIITEGGQQGLHILFSWQGKLREVNWIAHMLTGIWPSQGDVCFGMEPTPEERLIGQFFYNVWINGFDAFWGMDPYGNASTAGHSFRNMLYEESRKLRMREYQRLQMQHMGQQYATNDFTTQLPRPDLDGIGCSTGLLQKFKTFHDRQTATYPLIPHMTIQEGVLSAAYARLCLMNNRLHVMSNEAVTEPKPVKDGFYHTTYTIEGTCIYLKHGFMDPAPKREAAYDSDQRRRRPGGRKSKRDARYDSPFVGVQVAARDTVGNRYPVAPDKVAW